MTIIYRHQSFFKTKKIRTPSPLLPETSKQMFTRLVWYEPAAHLDKCPFLICIPDDAGTSLNMLYALKFLTHSRKLYPAGYPTLSTILKCRFTEQSTEDSSPVALKSFYRNRMHEPNECGRYFSSAGTTILRLARMRRRYFNQ